MRIIRELYHNSKLDHWTDGGLWLVCTLLGAFLPLYGGWVILTLFSITPTWDSFTAHAEFAIYAASFASASCYLMLREIKSLKDLRETTFPNRGVLVIIFAFILVISALIFAAVYLVDMSPSAQAASYLKLDKVFLRETTIGLLFTCMILSFLVVVADNTRASFDPTAQAKEELDDLENEFDNLD